jgi:DNA-binding transcriptional ArsR family regulator
VDELLAGLRAVAETTRLRLLLLCARGELTVSEMTEILGQSQPRVSRHLKLMCDGGLLDRFREGAFVFYRLAQGTAGGELARRLLDLMPASDPMLALDAERLDTVKRQRAETASAYFRANAEQWDRIRSLYVDEEEVEAAVARHLPPGEIGDLLDIGTGTGRLLEVLRPGGTMVIVDFAPHELEYLRADHAHRRLGFAPAEITDWCRDAGLLPEPVIDLPGDPLTVSLWVARRPPVTGAAARLVQAPAKRRSRAASGVATS